MLGVNAFTWRQHGGEGTLVCVGLAAGGTVFGTVFGVYGGALPERWGAEEWVGGVLVVVVGEGS
jgi:hypothetical protein